MNPSIEFLPDLGKHIFATSGKKELRIAGEFSLRIISWHCDEYRSITGACHIDGQDYVATLDFPMNLWNEFSQIIETVLYLHDHVDSPDRVIIKPIEPGLPVWIDLSGLPQTPTESTKTGEAFVPIGVKKVFGVRIVPNSEVLQRRHEWYLKFSRELLDTFRVDASALRRFVRHRVHHMGQFETEEFYRNLVAIFLIRQAIAGEPIEQVLEFMTNQWEIEFSSTPKLIRLITTIGENVGKQEATLVSGCMSLLLWHTAMKISAGAVSPSIEGDLVLQWGSSYEGAIELVDTARYCLARRDQWPQRIDQVEQDILRIEVENPQISALTKSRISAFPDPVWQHPELSRAVNAYVRYSVLIELSERGGNHLVANEILARCRQNIANIADWWYMFTPSEEQLFPLS